MLTSKELIADRDVIGRKLDEMKEIERKHRKKLTRVDIPKGYVITSNLEKWIGYKHEGFSTKLIDF
jgi:hypothetical protein